MIFIWAEDQSHGIGYQGRLPWHLPADMAFFKKTTTGHTLLSGARTFQSYGGRPLPHRKNLVLTSQNADQFPADVVVLPTVEAVLTYERQHPEETLYVSGGAQVFASLMPYVQTLLKTRVDGRYKVDTYMPPIDYSAFKKVSSDMVAVDEHNPVALTFERYERQD
ncbi:dihydrofolate reductase [uncultured Secundilactobacillus sp.]|uniref:dihydrofolate reductase n=1 Tax=uncultured Secundilactobacillus sp. TaxID=2813935 RepID=UPI0025859F0A|nr:dihydrofolate reductase [uncultured Secundilactobacillus sp.]